MIIIVEGVDGSGKTRLCDELFEEGYPTIKISPSKTEWYEWVKHKINFRNSVAICDRSFISDIVYRLYDEKPRRGMNLHEMCNILGDDVKIIHLESGTEFEDSIKRGEDNIVTKQASNKIKKLYNIVLKIIELFVGTPILKYNWHKNNIKDVIKFIKEEKNGVR